VGDKEVKKKNKYNFSYFILNLSSTCGFVWVWKLVSRVEHRMRMFENRVLRRIFGPNTDELTGLSRK
jgi:hypothetical protein